jgi:hypothetical protein
MPGRVGHPIPDAMPVSQNSRKEEDIHLVKLEELCVAASHPIDQQGLWI